jgi:hypothetical protein
VLRKSRGSEAEAQELRTLVFSTASEAQLLGGRIICGLCSPSQAGGRGLCGPSEAGGGRGVFGPEQVVGRDVCASRRLGKELFVVPSRLEEAVFVVLRRLGEGGVRGSAAEVARKQSGSSSTGLVVPRQA